MFIEVYSHSLILYRSYIYICIHIHIYAIDLITAMCMKYSRWIRLIFIDGVGYQDFNVHIMVM